MKVHKDDLRAHKAVKLNPTERDKFLSELTSLALKVPTQNNHKTVTLQY